MMSKYHSKDSYYPTKIGDIPISDFTKEQMLALLSAAVWALNYEGTIYDGIGSNQELFDPDFLMLYGIFRNITE